ncbi:hypothetical protein [Burkholderia sp. ABCPW 14]|uniref:hypothetical protein n=1 Tax=Burkholderia sp. ABCPW 14 TaxID=1637860 RepID=UPI0012E3382F|nr:hypothetical protein [Burkholderia sp. ABCPW 14]
MSDVGSASTPHSAPIAGARPARRSDAYFDRTNAPAVFFIQQMHTKLALVSHSLIIIVVGAVA